MDIISKIKQELNYVVFDEMVTSRVYKKWIEIQEKFKCLTIGCNYIAIYGSKNCISWKSYYSINFNNLNAMRYTRDMAALSLCLENTFLEILGIENFGIFVTNNNFSNVCIYIGISQSRETFNKFIDVKYGCLLKLFIHVESSEAESIEFIEQFFESTAFDIVWV